MKERRLIKRGRGRREDEDDHLPELANVGRGLVDGELAGADPGHGAKFNILRTEKEPPLYL
jgi:hypothetical protein